MSAENFLSWMLLEAKAEREGMPVDPEVADTARHVDGFWNDLCSRVGKVLDDIELED